MTDHSRLLQRLQQFIIEESQAQRDALERRWARPLAERVARGYAIEGLELVEIRRNGLLVLACQTNESRFREGDLIVLHRGDPHEAGAVQAALDYDDETHLEVGYENGNLARLRAHPQGWIADESMLDLSQFYLDMLEDIDKTRRGRQIILPLLSNDIHPQIDYARYERSWEEAYAAGLNDSQAEAVAQAYASDLVHLIQGPPGTGKTFVLAHLVDQWVREGQRVLVTALTHRAINNALNKIAQAAPGLPACKIGQEARAQDLLLANYENFAASGFIDLAGGYAVGATPFATRSERLSNIEFDKVVFDEASQITLPLAMMGMLAGDQYVFIGDECQLPPVAARNGSEFGRSVEFGRTSIFGYLSGRGYETLLTTTYRMNQELTDWPSRTFYQGKIRPAAQAAGRRLPLKPVETSWDFALAPEQPLVFLDLDHRNNTIRSRWEADVVVELVQALIAGHIPPHEIGVVVPYRAQGRAIRNGLRQALPSREMLRDLVVDTVERMQGQEREVVLVSLTTSSPALAAQLAEFFFQPERLNVAITRPRSKLIIVGSRRVLQAIPDDPDYAAWVKLLGNLLDHCTAFSIPRGAVI